MKYIKNIAIILILSLSSTAFGRIRQYTAEELNSKSNSMIFEI